MASSSKIVDLRNLLAERFPQTPLPAAGQLSTGIGPVDRQLGGGLSKSAMTELSSPHPSAGSALLIAALVHAAHRDGYFIALVDGRNSFDPAGLSEIGHSSLPNLLWVRCDQAKEALQAADLLLRDGNFPLVVVDLVLNPAEQLRKIPQTTWYRLQRLVEAAPTAFLVLTRQSIISSAQLKLTLKNSWALQDLEHGDEELLSRLRIEVRRTHAARMEMARAS